METSESLLQLSVSSLTVNTAGPLAGLLALEMSTKVRVPGEGNLYSGQVGSLAYVTEKDFSTCQSETHKSLFRKTKIHLRENVGYLRSEKLLE